MFGLHSVHDGELTAGARKKQLEIRCCKAPPKRFCHPVTFGRQHRSLLFKGTVSLQGDGNCSGIMSSRSRTTGMVSAKEVPFAAIQPISYFQLELVLSSLVERPGNLPRQIASLTPLLQCLCFGIALAAFHGGTPDGGCKWVQLFLHGL